MLWLKFGIRLEEDSVGFIQTKHFSVPSLDKTKQVLHFFFVTKLVVSLLNFDLGGFNVILKRVSLERKENCVGC